MNFGDVPSSELTGETVYGTHEDSPCVMSEKVQSLARCIYDEFEQMLVKYDQNVLKTLMPLVVNVLESLDSAVHLTQEHEVELELLRDDNEQLVAHYEKEKGARRQSEQKLLEIEDQYDETQKDLVAKMKALDSVVKMLELKYKNSQDITTRQEERENELKKEYAKLHTRYTDLFKTHMDYVERTRLLLNTSTDRNEICNFPTLKPVHRYSGPMSASLNQLAEDMNLNPSPAVGELNEVLTIEQSDQTDTVPLKNQATSPVSPVGMNQSRSEQTSEKRQGNSLYQILSFNDDDVVGEDECAEVTGSWVHPGDYASSVNDNYFGMGREVENLILENNELLATKNALNIVKDDLIIKVDELTLEQEVLREEIATLSTDRDKFKEKVAQLDQQIRDLNETLNSNAPVENEEEADVTMAQRKRFTRVEMARVLMERNQYKERFMELQDAVRYTEMVRAKRYDSNMMKTNKQTIWTFFSKLFSSGDRPPRPLGNPQLHAVVSPQSSMHLSTNDEGYDTQLSVYRRYRSDHPRRVSGHARGRTQAYGWSLPAKSGQHAKGASPYTNLSSGAIPVPVPVFCRPLSEKEPPLTLLCAAGVNLGGSLLSNYGRIGDLCSQGPNIVTLADEMKFVQLKNSPDDDQLDMESEPVLIDEDAERLLSSLVWICCATQTHGVVMIVDANDPNKVIESFPVEDKHILCVTSVPCVDKEDLAEYEERMAKQEEQEHADQLVPGSESTETSNNKSPHSPNKTETVIIGSGKLMKTTILTPPASPVHEVGPPTESEVSEVPEVKPKNVEQPTDSAHSPPLSSTPVRTPPEPGIDAFAQEESMTDTRNDVPHRHPRTTASATMWLGTKSGNIYVYSAVENFSKCLARVKLNDAVLCIVHCASRCVVALADGTIAIFSRMADGRWDFSQHYLMILGPPKSSVRSLSAVGDVVWCGCRNEVHVVKPRSGTLVHTLEAHVQQESHVRQMAALGDGVWVSIKMDSKLRLYHARTYSHLQDVDIEPYVSKMLGSGKVGFSLVRITALLVDNGRLWIGTSNGVIISVPLSDRDPVNSAASSRSTPSGLVRPDTPTSVIPWCSMAHAQLSFHGHRDAVKFFVSIPGMKRNTPVTTPTHGRMSSPKPPLMLIISGGEGYIDFRSVDTEVETEVDESNSAASEHLKCHLIMWQVAA